MGNMSTIFKTRMATPGEITPQAWAKDGQTILLSQFFEARQQLFRYDLRTHNATALGHPAGTYGSLHIRPNGDIFAAWQDSQTPSCMIHLDGETGRKLDIVLAAVDAPILIIQGEHDTRTPARPIRDYAAKLHALGKEIKVSWYESGHMGAFADVEQGIGHQARILDFAQRILQQ